jgi:uncharacterized protein YaaW (UPF0174 family)
MSVYLYMQRVKLMEDDELLLALELASDDELGYLADILFRRKFNPLDYIATPDVIEVQSLDRVVLVQAIADRFRFLAADGFTVLRRQTDQLTYREVLERVCQHLKIKYSQTQSVADIESELFLNLLSRAWQKMPARERKQLNASMQSALTEADLHKSLPPDAQRNPLGLVIKGGGAIAMSTVIQPAVMALLAKQLAWHLATYQTGKEVLKAGGTAIATRVQAYFSTYLARHGVAAAAARYGAVRTVFSVITPALWGVFFADLGWRAISTNYARIIPVIFLLAQIRLLRDI